MNEHVEKLELLARELYNSSFKLGINSFDRRTTTTIISEIFCILRYRKNIKEFDLDCQEIMKISTTFVSMGQMLNTRVKLLTCQKKKQEYEDIKILDYFDLIEKEDFHTRKINSIEYICSYHQESLFTHLHLACLVTLAFIIKNKHDVSTQELIKYSTISYLHDIGKPGSLYLIKKKKWTSFPFHGEMGAGLLLQLWTKEFGTPYTKELWEEICRTITVHMCGYHSYDSKNPETKYKWNILSTENPTIKENLYFLSFGDHYGALPDETVENIDDEVFISSRQDFINTIRKTYESKDFLKNNGFNGVIIFVRGKSASGKSTCVQKIKEMLGQNNIHTKIVERDAIMCKLSAKYLNITVSKKPTGEEYKKFYKYYQDNKIKLSTEIAKEMKNEIIIGIANKEIVIVDTVMSYYCSIDSSIPIEIQNAFVISVDVIRNFPIIANDGERLGISHDKQLELFGEKTFLSWLPDNGINHKNLSSVSTASSLKQSFPITRPRLCFIVSWNQHSELGYDEMLRQIKYICE